MKKLLSLTLALAMIASLFAAFPAYAATSGTCGDKLTWTLDDSGTLTISGTVAMWNWSWGDAPWYSNRTKITDVVIDDGVTTIGSYAFCDCTSLTSITIPDSVTSIGDEAFYDCKSLTSITIPDSVTTIGGAAFYYCNSLTSITVDKNNEYYCSVDGNLFSKDKKTLVRYAIGKTAASYKIPTGVTSIGNGAFLGCSSLTSIAIPDSVTSIGGWAFEDCTSLTSIVIPDSVTSIGDEAFSDCDSLTSITIPDSVTSIGNWAFGHCTSLTSITIPDSVTTIGSYAFFYCTSLTSVVIGDGVTTIDDFAFEDCTSLTSITIPDSVTTIGSYAFYDCSSLTSITIPDGVTSIGGGAFYGCKSLTSITIPDSVTKIDPAAFQNCTSLTSIVIPDSVTSIGEDAFYICSSLTDVYYGGSRDDRKKISIRSGNTPLTNATWHYNYVTYDNEFTYTVTSNKAKITGYTGSIGGEVTIPATIDGYTVNRIGSNAFSKCKGITSVVIPDGVTTINTGAFANCANLKEVTLPKALKTVGKNAFKSTAIETVNYKGGTSAWAIIDFTSGNDALTEAFSGGADSVTFRTVGVILSFTKVNITGCDGGVSGELVIPATVDGKKVAKIASKAFYCEINLTSLVIENGITAVKYGAFSGCSSLSAVTIPKSVKTIEGSAFANCPISDVYYGGTEADWNKMTIKNGNTALTNANIHFAE